MPNRILKESICRSDEINSLSWFEEVLFYRLVVNCDDYGRFDGREKVIKGLCFPLKDLRDSDITKALQSLSAAGLVIKYEVQGKPVLQLATWERHQQIRAKRAKYPGMDDENANLISLDSDRNQMISDDSKCPRNPIQSESNTNPNTKGKRASTFTPPDVSEVREYCQERKNNVDPERFVDFYTAKGWFVGKNKMKDWRAAVRNWEKEENARSGTTKKREHNYPQRDYDLDAIERALIKNG